MATTHTHGPDGTEGMGAGLSALMRMLRALFFGLRILIVVIFVWLVFSGVFKVEDGKEALLFRFGKLQQKVIDPVQGPTAVLTSGHWYWAWPYPVDQVKIIPAQQAISVSTESIFWPRTNPNQVQTPDPALLQNLPLAPGEDGYLLTGDTNIMHAVWQLTYRVSDARQYYLNIYDDSEARRVGIPGQARRLRGHEAIVRNVLANAVLAEMATWTVEDVLRSSRTSPADAEVKELLTENVRLRVEKRLLELDTGVEVQLVNLVDVQPPTATLAAFDKVVAASQDQSKLIEEAERHAATVVPAAEGEAFRILDEARAYKTRIVESVKAEGAYFQTVLGEYRKNPRTMLVALYTDTIRDVLTRVQTKYILHVNTDGQQEIRLQLGPEPIKLGQDRQTSGDHGGNP
ncbi:MAG: protease modulator HflK [Lentisphaeria bacterium]|nr:protease modulator HflK [Lentisphaeria bacterium]